jgi:phenylpropionate dioxygenase-like ring-hydroxylating dioxygenase large terminal subunit
MAMIQRGGLQELVDLEHGEISREVFVNEEIYQEEQERVFARTWLFVGHESQAPNPGDYFQSRMGEEAVLLVRDRKSQLHVFLNTCRHRGMKVCRYDEGNTLLFTCPFHGWSYDTDGRLVGVPEFQSAYHAALEKTSWGLPEARIANFYGSIWANWDSEAPAFEETLGDYAPFVKHIWDGDDGRPNGVEVFGGVHKWRMPSNWKFPATSFNGDAAHGSITHRSINVAAIGPQGERGGGDRHGMTFPRDRGELVIPELGHGGHFTVHELDEPYVETWQTLPEAEEYFRQAYQTRIQRLREASERRIEGGTGVFPNFSTGGAPRTVVIWNPAGVQYCEAWRFYFVDRDAPEVVKDALRRWQMRYSGPVGMTESDDMENWNYASAASRGTIARRYPYNYMMGLGHDRTHDWLPGRVSQVRAEGAQRARFGRWLEFMQARTWDEIYPKAPSRP